MSTNPSIVYEPPNRKSYTRVRNPDGDAYANSAMTLKFWECTGVDCTTINFVTMNDLGPVLTNSGEFITND